MFDSPSQPASDLDRFLKLPAVVDRSGLSKSEIYRRIAAGTFPRPVKLGERAARWRESSISRWQAEQS